MHPIFTLVLLNCIRLDVRDVSNMSKFDLADVMRSPVIITGALNAWNVPLTSNGFADRFGHHQVLARRTNHWRHRDEIPFGDHFYRMHNVDGKVAPVAPHVSIAEFLQHTNGERAYHTV